MMKGKVAKSISLPVVSINIYILIRYWSLFFKKMANMNEVCAISMTESEHARTSTYVFNMPFLTQ
jgi:hypothetical protein